MSILGNQRKSFSSKEFKVNAQMLQSNEMDVQLFEDVVKDQIERNKITYQYPARVSNAQAHRVANKYGYHPRRKGQPRKVCACCEQIIQMESLPICYSTTSLSQEQILGYQQFKLQKGVALFFQFIKLAIFYIFFRFLVCDAFNLVTNLLGQYCKGGQSLNPCQPTLWNQFSILNISNSHNNMFIQQILDLVTVVLSIIIFFFFRKKQYKFTKQLQEKKQTENTYTILVSGIPLIDFPTQKQLKKMKKSEKKMQLWHRKHLWKFFENKIKKWMKKQSHWKLSKGTTQYDFHQMKQNNGGQLRSSQIVTSISLVYNLGRLEILQNKKNDLVDRQKYYEKIRDKIDQQLQEDSQKDKNKQFGVQPLDQEIDNRFSTIPKQVQFLTDCQILLSKQYANDNSVLFNMTNLVGYAFISFQYQHYKQYILSQASKDSSFLSFNGTKLKVQAAYEPSQVNWQNFRHSESKRTKRILTTLSFIALNILITLIVILTFDYFRLTIKQLRYQEHEPLSANIIPYLTVLAIILILIFSNYIMRKIIRHFVRREKHKSMAQRKLSELKFLSFSQFFNTAIILLVVNRIYSMEFGSFVGLTTIVTGYVIISLVLSFILELLYPASIWNSLKYCCKYRNLQHDDNVHMFQIKLNQQYQYEQFNIVEKYANYIALFLFVSFYAHLTPIIVPIFAIYMFLIYWVDKINMFKRSKINYCTNFAIARTALKIFQSSIFFFSLGAVIFSFYIYDDFSYLHLIALIISFIFTLFLLLAPYALQRKLFANYQSSQKQTYDDCVGQGKFESTYWTTNPATYLVKQSAIVGQKMVFNPAVKKIYENANESSY